VPRTQDDVERTRSLVRIRVVTYNIHRAIGVDRRFRPDRIIRILSAYDADVVLLQEVDDGVPRPGQGFRTWRSATTFDCARAATVTQR
jgi:endonuclease/exonuclease/phosphatase family metal-dependent hydrolase